MLSAIRSIIAGICLTTAFAAAPSAVQAAESATDTFRASHAKVSELTAQRAAADALQKEVDRLLDYHSLTIESLGGPAHFPKRCETRCDELEGLLARLIRENYLRRLRADGDHKVEITGETKTARGVKVTTTVSYSEDGRPVVVEVAYLMHEVDGRWQVRDIITDGVSLARNYKYEFNQILKKDGIDGLIGRLESKLNLVAKKD